MIVFLRCLFAAILAVMVIGTSWASLQQDVFSGGAPLLRNPWGVMTLLDAYLGFLTFFVWVAYRERTMLRRIIWFVLIMILGNITMSLYVLIALFRIPSNAPLASLLLRPDGQDRGRA